MRDGLTDRLRDGLVDEAAHVVVGDTAGGLVATRRTVRRRRRRNVLVGVTLGSVALVVSVVVVTAISGDAPTSLQVYTPPTTEASPDDDGAAPDDEQTTSPNSIPGTSTTSAESGDDAPPVGNAAIVGTATTGNPTSVGGLQLDDERYPEVLVPWDGGFLAGYVQSVQPSTELPDELNSKFPQEVLDLFPDGIPPTVEEAAAIIAEADLTLQVMAVFQNNPEVEAAVYGKPARSQLMLSASSDGTDWSPVEIELPEEVALVEHIRTVGDRLVVVGTPPTRQSEEASAISVASTTDLVDWQVQTIDLEAPPELPEPFDVERYIGNLEIGPAGWIINYETMVEFRFEEYVPEEVRQLNHGYGVDPSLETGIEITPYDDDGEPTQPITITWEELGVDDEAARTYMSYQGESGFEKRLATWDGVPFAPAGLQPWADVVVLTHGFLDLSGDPDRAEPAGPAPRFSTNGVEWTPVPDIVDDEYLVSTIFVEDATVVVTQDRISEPHVYLVDAAGGWSALEVDGLPPGFGNSFGRGASGYALIVDGNPPVEYEQQAVVERDGLQLTLVHERTTRTYELLDVATGTVLAAEDVALLDVDDPSNPFQNLRFGDDELVTITDRSTGDTLVTFPADELWRAMPDIWYELRRARTDDLWLIATRDGTNWMVHDLPDEDPGEDGWSPAAVAANDDYVLVNGPNGWLRYEL